MKNNMTESEFLQKVKDRYGEDITVLTPYNGKYKKIRCRCNECGKEYTTIPYYLLDGRGRCPDQRKVEFRRDTLGIIGEHVGDFIFEFILYAIVFFIFVGIVMLFGVSFPDAAEKVSNFLM